MTVLSNSSGADSIRNFALDEDEDLGSDHSTVYFEIFVFLGTQTTSQSSVASKPLAGLNLIRFKPISKQNKSTNH